MYENLILASSSIYRSRLLEQLAIPFRQRAPDYDEHAIDNEAADPRCKRLAEGKAHSIAQSVASTDIILGSDQVAHLEDGSILHKPGDFDHARAQLMRCSDQWVYFSTGICLVRGSRSLIVDSETYRIRFRPLTTPTIESYLERDRPYDCAGSIRAEGLGITLLADAEGRDVNTLYGLPLMLLTDHLINLDIIS